MTTHDAIMAGLVVLMVVIAFCGLAGFAPSRLWHRLDKEEDPPEGRRSNRNDDGGHSDSSTSDGD